MDELLKITKETLGNIFSTIKKNVEQIAASKADAKDVYIMTAALLANKEITVYSGTTVPSSAKIFGNILYNTTSKRFYYWNGRGAVFTPLSTLLDSVIKNEETLPFKPFWLVNKAYWSTVTPFNVLDGTVTAIYKGATVNGYTKWILFVYEDSETQTYTAWKTGSPKYIYGKHAFDPDQPLLPWELWLPSDLATGSVSVDW